MVYSREVTSYSYSPYYSINKELDMADKDFYSSFNMVFGINLPDFDWFNNPYISATVYEHQVNPES